MQDNEIVTQTLNLLLALQLHESLECGIARHICAAEASGLIR